MLTIQHTKEGLSRAYISAVTFRAGVNLELGTDAFDYGVDGTFKEVIFANKKRTNSGVNLEFQMKASVDWQLKGQEIHYPLVLHSYNGLVSRMQAYRSGNITAKILVLLCLPKEESHWLELNEDHLLLRRCCYYHVLQGPTKAGHKDSKTNVKIPIANKVTPDAIKDLLKRVKEDRL